MGAPHRGQARSHKARCNRRRRRADELARENKYSPIYTSLAPEYRALDTHTPHNANSGRARSQLPRTLQLGSVGQPDWVVSVERRIDLTQELGR